MNMQLKTVISTGISSFALVAGLSTSPCFAATAKEDAEAAKNEIDLRIYQATGDLLVKQKEAEARQAIAVSEKLALQATLPATESKALEGKLNLEKFGAAAQAKAFDLAQTLAKELCDKMPARFSIYDETTTKNIVNARAVKSALDKLTSQIRNQSNRLDPLIAAATPAPGKKESPALLGLAAVTTGIKAVADLTALFKTNTTVVSVDYGSDTRPLFISAMASSCRPKIAGIGGGYLGELNQNTFKQLTDTIDVITGLRGELLTKVQTLQGLYEKSKDQAAKNDVAALAAAANALVKSTDTFITGLTTGESGAFGSLYNAARYLAYADRVQEHPVLDFNLRLEGMAITKDNFFTGQHLKLSGAAFLWYRLYAANGDLIAAHTERRISTPVKVSLDGKDADSSFWNSEKPADAPKE